MKDLTPARVADRLCELGLDEPERSGKAALFELALARFLALGAGPPEHVFWVPGRLEVFGKHTDYAGGRTLVAAVPRGFAVVAGRRAGSEVHVFDALREQGVVLDSVGREAQSPGDGARTTGWRNYVQTVVRRLAQQLSRAWAGCQPRVCERSPQGLGDEQLERADDRCSDRARACRCARAPARMAAERAYAARCRVLFRLHRERAELWCSRR